MPASQLPPGWYSDPALPTQQRYWDGTAWVGSPRPTGSNAPVTQSGPLLANYDRDRRLEAYRKKRRVRLVVLGVFIILIAGAFGVTSLPKATSTPTPTTLAPQILSSSSVTTPTNPPGKSTCQVVLAIDHFSTALKDTITAIPTQASQTKFFYTTYAEAQAINATELAGSLEALESSYPHLSTQISQAVRELSSIAGYYTNSAQAVDAIKSSSPDVYQQALNSTSLTKGFDHLGSLWGPLAARFPQC